MGHETLPHFRPGDKWRDQSARQLNALTRAIERLSQLTGAEGINVIEGPTGFSIHLAGQAAQSAIRDQTVVIVEEPQEEAIALRVRAVRYQSLVPQCCAYVWAGPEMAAYPDFGYRPIDYKPLAWLEVDASGGRKMPDETAAFLRAYRLHGEWIIEFPTVSGMAVVARSFVAGPMGHFLHVEPALYNEDEARWWTRSERDNVPIGNVHIVMRTWGNIPAGAYEFSLEPENPLPATADILEVGQIDGIDCVKLPNKIWAVAAAPTERHGGLRPVEIP